MRKTLKQFKYCFEFEVPAKFCSLFTINIFSSSAAKCCQDEGLKSLRVNLRLHSHSHLSEAGRCGNEGVYQQPYRGTQKCILIKWRQSTNANRIKVQIQNRNQLIQSTLCDPQKVQYNFDLFPQNKVKSTKIEKKKKVKTRKYFSARSVRWGGDQCM